MSLITSLWVVKSFMFYESKLIPSCYFSTKILIIDDDEVFMETLSFYLSIDKNQQFSKSGLALKELIDYQPHINEKIWLKTDVETDTSDRVHEQSFVINLDKMKDILSNSKRYNDISILIVDYKMPEMDGLVILEKLKSKPFKKILLTGKGDDKIGVNAFNAGLIDYFVSKDEDNLLDKLKNIIQKLKVEYFLHLTKRLQDYSEHISAISSNPDLQNYLYTIISKYNITEFYLIDFIGTYIFLDKDQKKYFFVVHSEEQLQNLASAAEQDGADKSVVDPIKKYLKLPFFGQNKNYWEIPGKNWNEYLYPIDTIKSKNENLHVSVIEQ